MESQEMKLQKENEELRKRLEATEAAAYKAFYNYDAKCEALYLFAKRVIEEFLSDDFNRREKLDELKSLRPAPVE